MLIAKSRALRAGRGLGHALLDQDFKRARYVIDTNVTETVYLIYRVGRDMRSRNEGRILMTGSRTSCRALTRVFTMARRPSWIRSPMRCGRN
jgi:short-subunit dehydrogenase